MTNATLNQEFPTIILSDDSFDIDLIAGLIAQPTTGCDRQAQDAASLSVPAALQSHEPYMTGFQILSAFGKSI